MNEINGDNNHFNWIYKVGFFIILALPILVIPPWFFPADWGKTIIFRSIIAILLFLFIYQLLFKKNEENLINIKHNKIIWLLAGFFVIYLLASIFSVDLNFSLWGSPYRGGGFITFAFYFIFAILAFILFKKKDWDKAWILSIITGILVSFIAVIQYYGLFDKIFVPSLDRPPSTMGNPIMLAIYLLLLSFITLSLGIKEKITWKKICYFLALLLFLYIILITGSRAAYLGIAIGVVYFLLFYPKRLITIKIASVIFILTSLFVIFYLNTTSNLPKIFEENKILKSITYRFSTDLLLTDPRFSSWQISLNAIKEKPLLGYGPENFAVGFDKHYNPSLPNLDIKQVGWWDKAHNALLEIAVTTGIPALLIYLSLFFILFWQLHKIKYTEKNISNNSLLAHGIQTTLIAYLVANFFSFDGFSSYLIFFLLISYALYITKTKLNNDEKVIKKIKRKNILIGTVFLILIIFLWQYNFIPLQINENINRATTLAKQKDCTTALALMDENLLKRSFLDSYVRMEYIEIEKICSEYYPENTLLYTEKGIEVLKEAVKIQPTYTRYWINLGELTTTMLSQEKDDAKKNELTKHAEYYFDKALQLAPKHQEIIIGVAKLKIASSDYSQAKDYSQQCINLNKTNADCYFYLAVSEIYLKDYSSAKNNLEIASSKGYPIESKTSLGELADAYGHLEDYRNLVIIYEKLILLQPNNAQYHSSLAFFYKQLGEYTKARQEAYKVLELSPQSKPNVDTFINSLP